MFKKGFTLQELLITLGIIGIVAAITGPAIVGLAPDKSKTMYMKAYNTLLNVTSEIMDDPSLYFPTYSAAGELICSGLYCAEHPNVNHIIVMIFEVLRNIQEYLQVSLI